MSDFKFSCPRCDQHIACDESYYGVQISCPACSTPIKVPMGHEPTRQPPPNVAVSNGLRIANSAPEPSAPRQSGPRPTPRSIHAPSKPRGKNWLTTFLLALFLGGLGADRFYNGRTGLGIGKLLTGGLCGVWSLIDIILLLTKKYQDAKGIYLSPAKRSHMVAALSIVGVVVLVNLAVAIAAVRNIKSEFTSFSQKLNSPTETTQAGEDRGVPMQTKAVNNRKGASSPAEAFAGFQNGIRTKDYSAAFGYLTPEAQTAMLGMAIGAVAMQKVNQAINSGPAIRQPGAVAARRAAEAKETKVTAILKKYNVSLKPGEFSEAAVAAVRDKGQCFQEMAEVLAEDIGLDTMVSGNLTGLKLNKDTASAKVNGEPIKFKRLGNTWFMDLEGIAEN